MSIVKSLLLLTLIFVYKVANSQLVNEIFAKNIKLPQNIVLRIPNKANFINNGVFADGDYYLKESELDDTVMPNEVGKLFNPQIKEYHDAEYTELQLEANYVATCSLKDHKFIYYQESILPLNSYLGVNDSIIYIPEQWKEKIGNDSIIAMSFICYARIDGKGYPIEKRQFVRPYKLITKSNKYDIYIKYTRRHSYAYLGTQYSGFAFRKCVLKDSFTTRYVTIVKQKIIKKLASEPFFATIYSDLSLPDDEVWMKRDFLPSKILGAPYFEKSTYILKYTYSNDDDVQDVKFYVLQSLNVNTGLKGDYPEPSEETITKYKLIIHSMVNQCIKEACMELKLNFIDNTCNCK